jgi:hypothetical protein
LIKQPAIRDSCACHVCKCIGTETLGISTVISAVALYSKGKSSPVKPCYYNCMQTTHIMVYHSDTYETNSKAGVSNYRPTGQLRPESRFNILKSPLTHLCVNRMNIIQTSQSKSVSLIKLEISVFLRVNPPHPPTVCQPSASAVESGTATPLFVRRGDIPSSVCSFRTVWATNEYDPHCGKGRLSRT